jgi:hypothetical protein
LPPIDEALLERCPDPALPVVGAKRRDNDLATYDANLKLLICQDRHRQLVAIVRKAQGRAEAAPPVNSKAGFPGL